MKLPGTLYSGYNMLKKSRLVVKKVNDDDALSHFQTILNNSQPKTPEDIILHRFVKGMYNENKQRFLSFIKNTKFECMVLWTESLSIVNYLGLRGVIYAKWTGKDTLYTVTRFQSTDRDEKVDGKNSYEHPLVRLQRKQNENLKFPVMEALKPSQEENRELVTEEDVPVALRETDDIPVDDELRVPEVLSLTRMSSVAMGTATPLKWGDMEAEA
jgi:hypothetical protein